MSKYVKNFVTRDIANRLRGVSDAVVVNVVGLGGNDTYELRKALRDKSVSVMVVKRIWLLVQRRNFAASSVRQRQR